MHRVGYAPLSDPLALPLCLYSSLCSGGQLQAGSGQLRAVPPLSPHLQVSSSSPGSKGNLGILLGITQKWGSMHAPRGESLTSRGWE